MKKAKLLITLSITILFALALITPHLLAQVKRGVAIPSDQVPEKLKALDIKDYFIESDFKRAGIIHALRGTVVVTHKATKEAYFGVQGDYIYENDSLETVANSRCRLRLFNEDVISMAPNTHLEVDEVVFKREKREKRSFLSMLKGRVMFYSLRLFSFRKASARLKTPTVVVGVRGTKFGVHVYGLDEKKAALNDILLAHSGDSIPYLAAVEGEKTGTKAIFYDGTGDVDGEEVGPGQKYEDGIITDATKEEMYEMESDTEIEVGEEEARVVEEEEKEEEAEEAEEEEAPAETGEAAPGSEADTTEQTAIVVSEETGLGTEKAYIEEVTEAQEVAEEPRGPYGYFTALLSYAYGDVHFPNLSSGEVYCAATYRSKSRQDFGGAAEGGTIEGYDNSNKMVGTGQGGWEDGTPYLKYFEYSGTTSGEDLGTSEPIVTTKLGSNTYLEWGYWNQPGGVYLDELTQSFAVYHPDNVRQGYYIFGPNPTDIGAMSGQYLYSGSAYGTMCTSGANVAMEGSFNCGLNFDTESVTDFGLSVSGSGYSASISGASGSLAPGDNHIYLTTSNGTWDFDGMPPSSGDVRGSVYGPNGEAVGGVWNMGSGYGGYATGIFEGTR